MNAKPLKNAHSGLNVSSWVLKIKSLNMKILIETLLRSNVIFVGAKSLENKRKVITALKYYKIF